MVMRNRREKRKRRVATAQRRMAEHKQGSGAYQIPKGRNIFNPKKEGTFRVDVVPFEAGEGNKFAEAGDLYYERTYWCHPYTGPDKGNYICNARCFKKKCAVCDFRTKLASDPDQDDDTKALIKSLMPKERQLWNFYVHEESEKGVQLFDCSFYNFGEYLDNKIRKADKKDRAGYQAFHDPDAGYTLRISGTEKSIGSGKPFIEFPDIEFKARKKPLKESLLAKAICLDELIKPIPDKEYKEIWEMLVGGDPPDDDEDEDEDTDDEDQDEDEEDQDDEDEPDDEEDEDEEDEDDEVDGDDDDSEDEEEPDSESASGEEDSEDEDEDDEDDDETEEDQLKKGDRVSFKSKKNPKKRLFATVKSINHKNGVAAVLIDDAEKSIVKDIDSLTKVADVDEIDDEEDEDEDDRPKRKKKVGKTGKKSSRTSDDDDWDDDDSDDEDEDEDTDDDDDPPFRKPKKKVKRGK